MKLRLFSGLLVCLVLVIALMSQPTPVRSTEETAEKNAPWSQVWTNLKGEQPPKEKVLNATDECRDQVDIGSSVEGRPIVACQILNSSDDAASPLLVIGTMHGDEPAGKYVVKRLIALKAITGSSIWVIKDANPDGSARGTRQNKRGVDINRNFPESWEKTYANTRTYSGKSAASEPETKNLMNVINLIKPKRVIIFHQPYDQIDCSPNRPDDLSKALAMLTDVKFECIGGEMSGSPSNQFRGTYTMWISKNFADTTPLTFELSSDPSSEKLDKIAQSLRMVAKDGPF